MSPTAAMLKLCYGSKHRTATVRAPENQGQENSYSLKIAGKRLGDLFRRSRRIIVKGDENGKGDRYLEDCIQYALDASCY